MDASARYFREAVIQSSRLLDSALAGLEEGCRANPTTFRRLCKELAESHESMPVGQLHLEDAMPSPFPDLVERLNFITMPQPSSLGGAWDWIDVLGDGAYRIDNMLAITAPNGRDLAKTNVSAPRLMRPAASQFAAEAVSQPGADDRPTIGGVVLWVDADNYLRVDRGVHGRYDVSFRGRIGGADMLFGRGRLESTRMYLRMERRGGSVRALCSADGVAWSSIGETEFKPNGDALVGLHAIGVIERTIYRGEFREGSAIGFEHFQLWQ